MKPQSVRYRSAVALLAAVSLSLPFTPGLRAQAGKQQLAAYIDEHAEELTFFESGRLKQCLDVSLSRVTQTLKEAEEKLR